MDFATAWSRLARIARKYKAKMIVNFEQAWSFQLFRRKLRNFRSLQEEDQMVCLVPPDPVQREVYRFKQLFDLEQRGFDPDRMAADEELERRTQHSKLLLGLVCEI